MRPILLALITLAAVSAADVRVNIQLGDGHPIRRHRSVVVHRSPWTASRGIVYAPPVVWSRGVVAPSRSRLVWEDSEVLNRREDWVDAFLPVNNEGDALFLRVQGRAQIDFAEVHFRNRQVQVIDFNESNVAAGTFRLYDFADGRHVDHVRLVARALTPRATVSVLMQHERGRGRGDYRRNRR